MLASGLDVNSAVALAIPVGLLAANLTTLTYIINGFFYRDANKAAHEGDSRRIMLDATVIPIIAKLALYFVLVFCGIHFGASVVQGIVDDIPEWVQNGLSVVGGVLPIVGFSLVIKSIGRDDYIPYFIIGYFAFQYFGFTTMGVAIFILCFVILKTIHGDFDLSVLKGDGSTEEKKERVFSKRDVNNLYWRWWWFIEVAHNYEGMQALSFCNALIPYLKRLYPKKEDFVSALERNLVYYNTNGTYGAAVLGITLAMEEDNALTGALDNDSMATVTNGIKTGLMGPLAGIGDTIDWGTWFKILLGIGMTLCSQGNWVGAVMPPLVFLCICLAEGFFGVNLGYRVGSESIAKLFEGGFAQKITDAAGIVGMTIMGCLASQYCSFAFKIDVLQHIADAFAPGIVPLTIVFVLYVLMKKKASVTVLTLSMIGIALVLSFFGIA